MSLGIPLVEVMRVPELKVQRTLLRRVLDFCIMIVSALLVCALAVGAFVTAQIRHFNPFWIFLSLIAVGFFAFAWEEYRSALRSVRFILFVCGWIVVTAMVILVVISYFGWPWLILALLLEQALFSASAYWLFGLRPLRNRSG